MAVIFFFFAVDFNRYRLLRQVVKRKEIEISEEWKELLEHIGFEVLEGEPIEQHQDKNNPH